MKIYVINALKIEIFVLVHLQKFKVGAHFNKFQKLHFSFVNLCILIQKY